MFTSRLLIALAFCASVLAGCGGTTSPGISPSSQAGADNAPAYTYGRFTVVATAAGQNILGGQFMPPAAMPAVSSAHHAIFVNYTTKELMYYRGGQPTLGFAVVTPDVSYLPRSVVRGHVSGIEMYPSWCPTAHIRAAMPQLPAGCLSYTDPQNVMGIAKFLISWDVGGWDTVRLHGSGGYPAGSFWQAETYGCVNLLDPAMMQLLAAIGSAGVREGIEVIVYR